MRPSPNTLLWRFVDAIVPTEWTSKQAKRLYEAAVAAEESGDWTATAVSGSVRGKSNRSHVPDLVEPQFGTDTDDDRITRAMHEHIARVRKHADRMERVLNVYGPSAFRKQVAQLRAPQHPFDAEKELLTLLNAGYDEIFIHGVRFTRDASGAFVKAA